MGLRTNYDEYRADISKRLAAWDACIKRGIKRRLEEAEQRVGDLPRRLPRKTHLELERAYAEAHSVELDDKETPADCSVETKLSQLEDGALVAERLSEAAAKT